MKHPILRTTAAVTAFSLASLAHAQMEAPFDEEAIEKARAALQSEGGLSVEIEGPAGQTLLLIPAGTFTMGSTPEQLEIAAKDKPNWWDEAAIAHQMGPEQPAHPVTISQPFYIGQTMVTIGAFREFVEATNYRTLAQRDGKGGMYYQNGAQRGEHLQWDNPHADHNFSDDAPVTQIAFEDALAYCRWLSEESGETYRLPTEAEWEYAARAGTESVWFFGDDSAVFGEYAHRGALPAPVASKKPNAFGLYDVHGNVWEWCADWFGRDIYSGEARVDPTGPEAGDKRVRRGGTYGTGPTQSRSAFRKGSPPDYRGLHVGFRVVREVN